MHALVDPFNNQHEPREEIIIIILNTFVIIISVICFQQHKTKSSGRKARCI